VGILNPIRAVVGIPHHRFNLFVKCSRLGSKTLIAGVYGFNSSAALNGTLTLDGRGNPNSIFIFDIASALTTGSASRIVLINGAQGSNVFFRIGSSATLGTTTSFVGDILALTSITLDNGDTINCGDALARNGAVTLDNNHITICAPSVVSASSALPSRPRTINARSQVALTPLSKPTARCRRHSRTCSGFQSSSQLAESFTQLSGEAGIGTAQAGTQAMNSFLSLVTNPFGDNRSLRAGDRAVASAYLQGASAQSGPLGHLGRRLWRPNQHQR
jgi:hypothetical protein